MNKFLKELKYLNEVFSNFRLENTKSFLIISRSHRDLADIFIMYRSLEKDGLSENHFNKELWSSFKNKMINKSDYELYISLKDYLEKVELNAKLNEKLKNKSKNNISKI
ncbi:hypothetical protein [Bordetella trematum]|uniref:hypothetical protein n=1 Tax=Bordetella trematum TaxID=123899 RepID=UPI0039894A23